jgi:predicted HTH domain antitoxin
MPKKQEKQAAVVSLQKYMAEGHSFTSAAELAKVPIEQACELVTARVSHRKHNSAVLEEASHAYLVKALKALGGLADTSIVPSIRLAAAQSLLNFFCQVDRMQKERETLDGEKGKGPIASQMQVSMWNFTKGEI